MSLFNYFKRIEDPPQLEVSKKRSLDDDDNNEVKKLKSDSPVNIFFFFNYL